MSPRVIFLAGDSFPRNGHIEAALRSRLSPAVQPFLGQESVNALEPGAAFSRNLEHRVRLLEGIASKETLLIGRSSGARAASLFAFRNRVAGLVCLGFPFQSPDLLMEIERSRHLATISTPTLIIQGVHDAYGGAAITETYPLSRHVSFRLVDADHEFRLSKEGWDAVAALILDFRASIVNGLPPAAERFDEEYYGAKYPDVAAAVVAGAFPSGHAHYQAHGRDEKRRYRVLIEP